MSFTIIEGYFWNPAKPDLTQFGTLSISEENETIELFLRGLIDGLENSLFNVNYHEKIKFIYGFSTHGKYLLVGNLRIKDYNGRLTLDPLHSRTTKITMEADYYMSSSKDFFKDSTFLINRLRFEPQFSAVFENESTIVSTGDFMNFFDSDILNEDEITYKLQKNIPIEIPFDFGKFAFDPDYESIPFHPDNHLIIKKSYSFYLKFNEPISFKNFSIEIEKIRHFFTLIIGTYISLESISLFTNKYEFEYNYSQNKKNIYYQKINNNHIIANLEVIIKENLFDGFLVNYDKIKLPLTHYIAFIESDKRQVHQHLLSLVSALEIIFNITYKAKNSRIDELPKVAKEILAIPHLTKHQRDFLLTFKHGNKIGNFKIKDKLIKLIEESEILKILIKDVNKFASDIIELRHYLVHNANLENLDLYNNEITLGKYNMKLKIILEYYILFNIGLNKDLLEEKIRMTMVNMAQFR